MPTLSRWFTEEQERLACEGKSALADTFDILRAATFEPDIAGVLAGLPRLDRLAAALGEPAWQRVADYYTIFVDIHWQGLLARGLDRATGALVLAQGDRRARRVLALYLRESLLDAWLLTDGPARAADVLDALDELAHAALPADLRARFDLQRAAALVELDPAYAPTARRLALSALPAMEWPEAYLQMVHATTLAWVGRFDDAIAEASAAVEGLAALGCHIEAAGAQITLADWLLQTGEAPAAWTTYREALSAAQRSINRAHVGFAQAGLGRTLVALGDPAAAIDWLDASLDSLDGLGWLRAERDIADARRSLARQIAYDHTWNIVDIAETRAYRLQAAASPSAPAEDSH